jgi:U6 snRNA-associated Sm-like protein LSm3
MFAFISPFPLKPNNRAAMPAAGIQQPFDLVRLSLDERVFVSLRGDRTLRGTLYAFDQHLNMVLGDAVETVTTVEVDPETLEELIQRTERKMECLFVRGDTVVLVSPPVRTA